jgi:hypothetical protein
MPSGDSSSGRFGGIRLDGDRDLLQRLSLVLALIFVITAAFSYLLRTYSEKFFDNTGAAQWIWAHHRMSDNVPLAFFAARDFTLPEKRVYTRLKILGDPEYTVFLNGREIAGRRAATELAEDRTLDVYDVSSLVKTGRNRLVVAVRAPQGVGGLIASVDIAPEVANWVVTDGAWKIYRRWDPRIIAADPRDLRPETPVLIGEPPIGRWNYLETQQRELVPPPEQLAPPRESFEMIGWIPRIRTVGGIAVAVSEKARATAFDFDFTHGRLRLVDDNDRAVSEVVNVRFANLREELDSAERNLRPIVFAPGEHTVTTPESHDFRYVLVFGRGVRVEVGR